MTKKLYHYTRTTTYKLMLESNKIRMSEHKFLNDDKEITSFFKLIEKVIEKNGGCLEDNKCDRLFCMCKKQNGTDYSKPKEELNKKIKFVKKIIQKNELFNYYVFSLTEEGDSHLLWSEFVQNDGVAISFATNNLVSQAHAKNSNQEIWELPFYKLLQVQYLDHTNGDDIEALLNKEIAFENYFKYFYIDSESVNKDTRYYDKQANVHKDAKNIKNSYPYYYRGNEESLDAETTLGTLINDFLYFISTISTGSTEDEDEQYEHFLSEFKKKFESTDQNNNIPMKVKVFTLLSYLPVIKHKYFAGEKEWRYIVLTEMHSEQNSGNLNLQYDVSPFSILYRFNSLDFSDLIKDEISITAGPLLSSRPKSFQEIHKKNLEKITRDTLDNLKKNSDDIIIEDETTKVTVSTSIVKLRK